MADGISLSYLRYRTDAVDRSFRLRTRLQQDAAGLGIAGCAYQLIQAQDEWLRVGVVLMLLGVATTWLRWRQLTRFVPTLPTTDSIGDWLTAYRSELERQRDVYRTFWSWHLLPMVPGIGVLFGCSYFGDPIAFFGVTSPWVLVVGVAVWFAADLVRARAKVTEYQTELGALGA